MSSLAVTGADMVVTLAAPAPIRGDGWSEVEAGVLEGASIRCSGDRIVAVGDVESGDVELDARGCTVIPGLVDCHTHLPFYGWRADEDAARLSGVRYESLHRDDAGIYRSARMLAEAGDEEVAVFASGLALEMLATGTTTFETKSGYGLATEAELRQLELARRLAASVEQTVVTTCLAAHAVPRGSSEGEWVGEAAAKLLPLAVEEGLATACDVYVETIAFAHEHAARLATAADALGIPMRMHADQLADNQSASFATRWGFRSADHLNHTSRAGVRDLAAGDTAAVLLPGATFTLRQATRPPARDLIDSGAIVALGSDFNPGTSPIGSMLFVIALACRLYGMRPLEALAAATVNSAWVLGLHDEVGRIAPGLRADLVILEGTSFDSVPYRPDHNHVVAVVCGGRLVVTTRGAEERLTT